MAVSGGVDSVVLLDLLCNKNQLSEDNPLKTLRAISIVVAHFDHGIRPDSAEDRLFVEELAKKYGLPFVFAEGRLGSSANEATARSARYKFLEKVRSDVGAAAIITAHHEDDVLETAILNIMRGTGRLGLSSLKNTRTIKRPLLGVAKAEILNYAKQQKLAWRDDPTNADTHYRRNYVRAEIMPQLTSTQRQALLSAIANSRTGNDEIDRLLGEILKTRTAGTRLERAWFLRLEHAAAKEVLAAWLRQNGLRSFDRAGLERLTIAVKTAAPGKQLDVLRGTTISVQKNYLALVWPER